MTWFFIIVLVIALSLFLYILYSLRRNKVERAALEGDAYYDRVTEKTVDINYRLLRVKRDTKGTELDIKDKRMR